MSSMKFCLLLVFALAAHANALKLLSCQDGEQCKFLGVSVPRSLLAAKTAPVCARGQYLQLVTGTCKACAAGSAKNATGAGTCTPCKAGTIAAAAGSAVCTACEAGYFSTGPLPKVCTPCPAGTYAITKGSSKCINCFENYYSAAGWAQCKRCPTGTSTNGKIGSVLADCK